MKREKKDLKGVNTKYEKYGRDCFVRWGKLGGNPILLTKKEKEQQGQAGVGSQHTELSNKKVRDGD